MIALRDFGVSPYQTSCKFSTYEAVFGEEITNIHHYFKNSLQGCQARTSLSKYRVLINIYNQKADKRFFMIRKIDQDHDI